MIEVRTQTQLEKALNSSNQGKDEAIYVVGPGPFTLRGNATATLWGNATATLRGNATATLRENATATLWENATATLWENATATLWGNATARSFASHYGKVEAAKTSVVLNHGSTATISGGRVLEMHEPQDAKEWCEFYGVEVKRGIATLFKALDENFQSSWGIDYSPGSTPEASDWDGGEQECGLGLHFSPSPGHALDFMPEAEKFVACGVRVKDIAVHPGGQFPEKVKAPAVAKACYEVDRDGEPVEAKATA